MKKIPKVYGTRICPSCRGIIHGKAFRTKWGRRRKYFCNERCVKYYLKKEIEKYLPKYMEVSEKLLNKETKRFIRDNLEPVFVIAP